MISDAKRRADRKWRAQNYDKICICVPSGLRQLWKDAASDRGLSLAQLIQISVKCYIGGDSSVKNSD